MGRSDNIDDMLVTNFNWDNDALTIQFRNTKSGQAGETTSDLFANWKNLEICVILRRSHLALTSVAVDKILEL